MAKSQTHESKHAGWTFLVAAALLVICVWRAAATRPPELDASELRAMSGEDAAARLLRIGYAARRPDAAVMVFLRELASQTGPERHAAIWVLRRLASDAQDAATLRSVLADESIYSLDRGNAALGLARIAAMADDAARVALRSEFAKLHETADPALRVFLAAAVAEL